MLIRFRDGETHEIVETGGTQEMMKEVSLLSERIAAKVLEICHDELQLGDEVFKEVAHLVEALNDADRSLLLCSTLIRLVYLQALRHNS